MANVELTCVDGHEYVTDYDEPGRCWCGRPAALAVVANSLAEVLEALTNIEFESGREDFMVEARLNAAKINGIASTAIKRIQGSPEETDESGCQLACPNCPGPVEEPA